MGKKKDISVEKKSAIMALLKAGRYFLREIARLQEVSHCSVAALKSKTREGQENFGSLRQNCGRKREKKLQKGSESDIYSMRTSDATFTRDSVQRRSDTPNYE